MSAPENYRKLGNVGIAFKGEYKSDQQYKYANSVYYDGSTYIALKDNPSGNPKDDRVNWMYLARGVVSSGAVTSVNGQTGDVELVIPSKTSELENDSGYIPDNKVLETKEEVSANTNKGYLADALVVKEINGSLMGFIVTKTFTITTYASTKILAQFYSVVNLPITTPSGYTALCIKRCYSANYGYNNFSPNSITNTLVSGAMQNIGNAESLIGNITLEVVFVKNI